MWSLIWTHITGRFLIGMSRGLVGHSMGGYGASRIGMKHPDVFGSLYIMSPCCLSARPGGPANAGDRKDSRSSEERPPIPPGSRSSRGLSWRRRRPGHPTRKTLRCTSTCRRRMAFRSPKCWQSGRRMRRWPSSISTLGISNSIAPFPWTWATRTACAVDAGKLHDVFDKYGIANSFEIYSGTHTSAVADRFQNHVMPFFSKNLCFQASCQ